MRSPNRTHDRKSFFKYMPASTGAIVLRNTSLRWSSPSLFNDPFDVPREMIFGATPEELVQAIARYVTSLIEKPPEQTDDLEPGLKLAVDTVRSGVTPEAKEEMLASLNQGASTFRPSGDGLEALRAMWRFLIPDLRILCLTESPSHAAMWLHYAAQYTGVVLEFACDDRLDSASLAAKPVEYPSLKPHVYTVDGWAELLSRRKDIAIRRILHLATHTKSPDWSYEREWRITGKTRPGETGLSSDYKFHPEELIGVYAGPRISPDDKSAIFSLASSYPKAARYETTIGMSREFEFSAASA